MVVVSKGGGARPQAELWKGWHAKRAGGTDRSLYHNTVSVNIIIIYLGLKTYNCFTFPAFNVYKFIVAFEIIS